MVYKSIQHAGYGWVIFNTNIGFIEVLFIHLISIKMYESFSILKFSKLSLALLNINMSFDFQMKTHSLLLNI